MHFFPTGGGVREGFKRAIFLIAAATTVAPSLKKNRTHKSIRASLQKVVNKKRKGTPIELTTLVASQKRGFKIDHHTQGEKVFTKKMGKQKMWILKVNG